METQVLNFATFKHAVAKQFERMQKHPMFRVSVEKDEMWATYLAAFPPGTNPVFRERTEYDCSCCRHFVRDVGNAVAIIDGKVVSGMGRSPGEQRLRRRRQGAGRLVRSRAIKEPFLHYERTAGTDKSFEGRGTKDMLEWNHFFVPIAPGFVVDKKAIPTAMLGAALHLRRARAQPRRNHARRSGHRAGDDRPGLALPGRRAQARRAEVPRVLVAHAALWNLTTRPSSRGSPPRARRARSRAFAAP
jgi:hypothetical protein